MINPASLPPDLDERDSDECLLIDWENARKDRADETLDAKRIHGGLTLDQFFEGRE